MHTAVGGLTQRRVLGVALVIGWVAWLVALWAFQPRLVPQDFLADELAHGKPVAYRVVTVDEDGGPGPLSTYRLQVRPASSDQLDEDGSGQQVTVAYWVDAPVASLRVLDMNGVSSDTPAAVLEQLRAAGVPEADVGELMLHPPAGRTNNAGVLLLALATLVVVLGPRPRRGTRWFWFWLVGGPLLVGVPVFALAELLRPRYEPEGTVHERGTAGRWNGLLGFALGFVLSIAGAGALLALGGLSPIWFLRV